MNEQMFKALMQLLGDMVSTLQSIQGSLSSLMEGQKILLEQTAPKPKATTKSHKKKAEPKTDVAQPPKDSPFLALESAIYELMKSELGDIAKPVTISQGENNTFIIDGVTVTNDDMNIIRSMLTEHPDAATATDIAAEAVMPVSVVYLVRVLMEKFK